MFVDLNRIFHATAVPHQQTLSEKNGNSTKAKNLMQQTHNASFTNYSMMYREN